ncbi:MAG TPA: alpha/beta hydrolase [Dehalococcoidia bacterium]|nr:alpha/beta hydrolase [Dehalococcoidia bacterium]
MEAKREMSGVRREPVTFESGGVRMAALFFPGEGPGPARRPCVVLGHGLGAVKEARLDAFAERFAAAGLACLAFDYRGFGESGGEPRQVVDIRRQQEDWRAAIAFARSLDGVDPDRIGLWGTSFSGGHVLEVAASDGRVRAVVAQVPLVDGRASVGKSGLRRVAPLMLAALRDVARQATGRPPYLVPLIGPPGSLGFLTTPESEPGYRAIVTNAPTWRNEIAARLALRIGLYRPIRSVSKLRCPVLYIAGERDTLTPAPAIVRAFRRTPDARLYLLPVGHFDAYVGQWFEEVAPVQTAFFQQKLGAA